MPWRIRHRGDLVGHHPGAFAQVLIGGPLLGDVLPKLLLGPFACTPRFGPV